MASEEARREAEATRALRTRSNQQKDRGEGDYEAHGRKIRKSPPRSGNGREPTTCGKDRIHRRPCARNWNGKSQAIKEGLTRLEEDEP